MRISMVTSLYKSAGELEELCERARNALASITADYEIILVNDGSPDDSLIIARGIAANNSRVEVIDLSRNFGQHPALMTGLSAATGDYIFICDSDLEEEPEWIGLFLEKLQETSSDVVYGVQTARKGGWVYRFSRSIFYKSLRWISGITFPANITTSRLMTRRYVEAVLQFEERELFAAGIWHMAGFEQTELPVQKLQRSDTTYTLSKLVGLFVNAVTAFSVRPLQIISIAGVALSVIALIFISILIYKRVVIGNQLEGWTSVIATTLLLGGITLFFNGVIAIYLSKIFLEVKRRPLTIIREIINPVSANEQILLDNPSNAFNYHSIINHYEACLEEHGTGPRAVDWKNDDAANTRYDVMLGLIQSDDGPVTILDFGCGLGDLKHHIDALGLDRVKYEGLDLSPAFVDAARTALPDITIHCMDILQDDGELPDYDYIFMNGIFTRRQELDDIQMLAYFELLCGKLFQHAKKGLAFNVMSMNVDWKGDKLFHPDLSQLSQTVARCMSQHMILRNDYGLHECTCYVYRKETLPRIDDNKEVE